MKSSIKKANIFYTCNVQTNFQKIDKVQKNLNWQPTKHLEERYKLTSSTYQNANLPNFRPPYKQKEQNFSYYKRKCNLYKILHQGSYQEIKTKSDYA